MMIIIINSLGAQNVLVLINVYSAEFCAANDSPFKVDFDVLWCLFWDAMDLQGLMMASAIEGVTSCHVIPLYPGRGWHPVTRSRDFVTSGPRVT